MLSDRVGSRAEPADPAEIWGRRIGRGLGALLLVGLLFWLASTYL